jgi:hypothetical protein
MGRCSNRADVTAPLWSDARRLVAGSTSGAGSQVQAERKPSRPGIPSTVDAAQ